MRLGRRRLAAPGATGAGAGGRGGGAAGAPPKPSGRGVRYDFDAPDLPLDFQWLRTPFPERIFSLAERPGFLRLIGRESIGSFFEQALVARRQQHFSFRAETELDFAPETFQQAAGLTLYYNRHKFHFLAVTHDAGTGGVLTIMSCLGDWPDGKLTFPLAEPIPLGDGPVGLAAEIDGADCASAIASTGEWLPVGPDPRRQHRLGRRRPRRARLVHRRLRRHGRVRHQRCGDAGRFRLFPI